MKYEIILQAIILQNKIWAKPVNRVHLDVIFIVNKQCEKCSKEETDKNYQKEAWKKKKIIIIKKKIIIINKQNICFVTQYRATS